MNDWTDGYVTEIPYSINHFPEMAPAHLNLALLHLGLAAPALEDDFTYLELGFGQGLGLNLLAATHPQGQFFGNDFMPAHVRAAQRLATFGGLDNLTLFEDSFVELLERPLPPMDYIVLHGVYSWVNPENRVVIVHLLRKLLKPGGVVYVSYNCLPGWSAKAPLQRLMCEFAQRQASGTVLERFHAARDLLKTLDESEAAFFTNNAPARSALRNITQASDAYLLHEFAPQGWSPFYHTDVAQHLAAADLGFVGSARLFNNFPAYSLPPKTRVLLETTADAGLRELLRDFAMQTQLRRDIFVRGARQLPASEVGQRMGALRLALLRPLASCALTCQTPGGELHLDEDICAPILQCLATAPQELDSLTQLAALSRFEPARCEAQIEILVCLGYIGIAQEARSAGEHGGRVHALNQVLLQRLRAGERISGLASAALGTAVEISYHDLLFLAAQQAGCHNAAELGVYALDILAANGAVDETLAKLGHEAHNFLRYGDEFYRSLELF
jgi:SAM-dependent methyltransferase